MSNTPPSDLPTLTRRLQIIHAALLVGCLTFLIIVAFVLAPEPADDLFITYLACGVALLGVTASFLVFNQLLNGLHRHAQIDRRFERYVSASIVRYALIEGPLLFAIVSYLLEGSSVALAVAAVLLAVFIYVRPNRQRIVDDLGLDDRREL